MNKRLNDMDVKLKQLEGSLIVINDITTKIIHDEVSVFILN